MYKKIFSGCVVLGLGLGLAAGCNSSGRAAESEKAVQSMSDTNAQLVTARDTVIRAVAQLGELQNATDLQATFKEYIKAVADVQSAGDTAVKRGQEMREKREAYLAKWQAEADQIQNPEVKAGLEQRRQQVRDEYERVSGIAEGVKADYQPFLKGLQDVQTALSIDLTPAGVKSMKPAIEKTKSDGNSLKIKLDALNAEMTTLIGKMTPPPPPAPPAKSM